MSFSKGNIPLYFQVYLKFKQDIIMGVYPPGSTLPGLHELYAKTGVSQGMIRKAMELLESEGLITKKQRLGTIVNDNVDQIMWVPTSSIDEVRSRLVEEDARPISEEWVSLPDRVKKILDDNQDTNEQQLIYKSHFLMVDKSNNKRRALTDLYLPFWRYQQVSPDDLKQMPLKTLANKLSIKEIKQIVRPWFCTSYASQYLRLPEGTPIFHRTWIPLLEGEKPLCYFEQLTTVYALERTIKISD